MCKAMQVSYFLDFTLTEFLVFEMQYASVARFLTKNKPAIVSIFILVCCFTIRTEKMLILAHFELKNNKRQLRKLTCS